MHERLHFKFAGSAVEQVQVRSCSIKHVLRPCMSKQNHWCTFVLAKSPIFSVDVSKIYIYMFMSAFLCLYLKQNRIQFSTACGSPVSVCAWRWWGPGAQHRSKQLLLLLENAEVSCSFCFHGPVFCWQLLACCLAFPSCFFLSLWVPWSRGRSPRRRMLFRRGSLPCSWRRWWRPLSREFASSEGVVC